MSKLTKLQKLVINCLKDNGSISEWDIKDLLGLNRRQLNPILTALEKKEIIKQEKEIDRIILL